MLSTAPNLAMQVLLTDNESQVLLNLRACMHLNTQQPAVAADAAESTTTTTTTTSSSSSAVTACQPSGAAAGGAVSHALEDLLVDTTGPVDDAAAVGGTVGGPPGGGYAFTDEELFDDAEEVEDFDLGGLLSPRANPSTSTSGRGDRSDAAAAKNTSWDGGNMVVRSLDWCESRDVLDGALAGSIGAAGGVECTATAEEAPKVPIDEKFAMILGNEVMYEPAHARLVASVICHRLAPGGRALLCCAVRDHKVFEEFSSSCKRRGLRYRALRVAAEEERDTGGIRGREGDYEGGYLLMAVDHESSPAGDWHRDDFKVME